MVGFRDNGNARAAVETSPATPRRPGYRSATATTHLIGNRLSRVYEVASGIPGDMGAVLRDLADKDRNLR